MLADIVAAIDAGRLSPVEPVAYPLDRAAQALQDQLDRKIVGKTVLVP
jgi:NADPH:quinone reductase-like Zn-dependent oxidoreductase